MQINIRLNGNTVSVSPLAPTINGQGNQTLQWKAEDNSDEFDFDNPPITFDATDAPISGINAEGDSASATDNVSTSGDYTYHVHLIDSQGNHITWPPSGSQTQARSMRGSLVSTQGVMTGTDPTIKNRPQ
jgi:hypothetical protein